MRLRKGAFCHYLRAGRLYIFGGMLIYLGINTAAREMLERKLFF